MPMLPKNNDTARWSGHGTGVLPRPHLHQVWSARFDGKPCILKEFLLADASRRRQFLKEAKILRRVRHPYVVPLEAIFLDAQHGYLHMPHMPHTLAHYIQVPDPRPQQAPAEVCGCPPAPAAPDNAHPQSHTSSLPATTSAPGGTAHGTPGLAPPPCPSRCPASLDHCPRASPAPEGLPPSPLVPGECLGLVGQLLQGLTHLHACSVVHGDLSPNNILMAADRTPRIADFGLSRFSDSTATVVPGTVLVGGTAGFCAPEVSAGEPATAPSDVYSLGKIFQCLPLEGEVADLVGRMVLADQPARPSAAETCALYTAALHRQHREMQQLRQELQDVQSARQRADARAEEEQLRWEEQLQALRPLAIELPPYWVTKSLGDTSCALRPTGFMASRLQDTLQRTWHCGHTACPKIRQVLRVENVALWRTYCRRRLDVQERHAANGSTIRPLVPPAATAVKGATGLCSAANEVYLFHGTTSDKVRPLPRRRAPSSGVASRTPLLEDTHNGACCITHDGCCLTYGDWCATEGSFGPTRPSPRILALHFPCCASPIAHSFLLLTKGQYYPAARLRRACGQPSRAVWGRDIFLGPELQGLAVHTTGQAARAARMHALHPCGAWRPRVHRPDPAELAPAFREGPGQWVPIRLHRGGAGQGQQRTADPSRVGGL